MSEQLADDVEEIEAESSDKVLARLDASDWNWGHTKAILVAGTGFLTDSYDNFIISLVVPMLAILYFNNKSLPAIDDSWLKAASSWGNLIGQLFFGIAADILGRKKMYGVELMILIIGALGCAFTGTPYRGFSFVAVLAIWRFILGVGVGGDYPVSAIIASEFAATKNRGTMIALVFSMQGVGILLGALVTLGTLAAFKQAIISDYTYLDYVWRFIAGFAIVPSLCAVYFRLTLSESPRFTIDVEGNVEKGVQDAGKFLGDKKSRPQSLSHNSSAPLIQVVEGTEIEVIKGRKGSYCSGLTSYFGQWVNAKVLIGTAICWFLLDVGYYGTNLNTSVILSAINFTPTLDMKSNESIYNYLWTNAVGTLIVNLFGNVPGYFFTAYFVDKWGRLPIQIMGFVVLTICFTVLAIFYNTLKNDAVWAFVLIYSLAQFFFNFGPNATTFIIPAEVFPTHVRSTGHGISAATGKCGAILASQCFAYLVDYGGAPGSKAFMKGLLGIFAALCFLGLLFTFLLPETMNISLEDISDIKFNKPQEVDKVVSEASDSAYQLHNSPTRRLLPSSNSRSANNIAIAI